MSRFINTLLSITVFSCYPLALAEAATNKCTDGKQVTYANLPCEELGLKPAGLVRDRVTVVPAAPKPKKIPTESSSTDSNQPDDRGEGEVAASGRGQIKPINPLIEKLTR